MNNAYLCYQLHRFIKHGCVQFAALSRKLLPCLLAGRQVLHIFMAATYVQRYEKRAIFLFEIKLFLNANL
jgi:hypothetical protein